jgi:hypothetical protein
MAMMAGGAFVLTILLCWLFAPGFREAAGSLAVTRPAFGPDPDLQAELGAERDELRSRYWGNLAACRPDRETDPADEAPPELPMPEGRDQEAPSAGDAPTALEAAPPPPPPPPPPEPEPVPEEAREPEPRDAPKPGRKPKPARQAKPEGDKPAPAAKPKPKGARPGEQLVIPAGSTDMGFLKGCWKSDAGLMDGRYHQPILMYLCFPDGGGRVTQSTHMLGPSGRTPRATCSSGGKATLSGGRLVIRVAKAPCKGERGAFSPGTITCVSRSSSAASCTFLSDNGVPAKARITRQS